MVSEVAVGAAMASWSSQIRMLGLEDMVASSSVPTSHNPVRFSLGQKVKGKPRAKHRQASICLMK